VREELRGRHFEEGETFPDLARKTGIPHAQVKCICSASGSEAGPAELVDTAGQHFEVGTGVGTPRAFPARLTHLTDATMRLRRNHAAANGPAWIRTRVQRIMSPLL
jgi:hypothetical protein